MIFNTPPAYYQEMDRLEGEELIEPLMGSDEGAVAEALNLGTAEIGTTTNPMGNTWESMQSRIREGAGRLEFSFIGKGKGNAQSPTPESFGTKERRDMKELLTINDVKSSVHAAVHNESLAGFGQGGFNGQQREEALKEIKRAIDFAGDVTDGGALVFHMTEWQRPMTYAGNRTLKNESQWMFKGYDTEDTDTQLLVVDSRTGKFIEGVKKDQRVYEPIYKEVGETNKALIGSVVQCKDDKGNMVDHKVASNDWVTIDGRVVPHYTKNTELLFERVPEWDPEGTNFRVQELVWDDFVDRATKWNEANPDAIKTPEEIFAKTQFENRVLQAKGGSLYHAARYENYQRQQKKLREALDIYDAYEGDLPPEELEHFKRLVPDRYISDLARADKKLPTEELREQLRDVENSMRHIHQSSASADAQALEYQEIIKHMQSAEDYGLQKTAEAVGQVGMLAREQTIRKGLSEAIYAAPENWDQKFYGSHPDEMRKIVEKSREEMAKQLMKEKKVSGMQQGLKEASKHIRATLDIGHMNMWRQYYDPLDDKGNSIHTTAEAREKAFEKWMLNETEKLTKDGIVGHVHLADNFGYGDEHITPGQGNVPMKEFLKRMEKAGMKDMIVESGSYNVTSAMYDTLSLVGSPVYGVGRAPRFDQMQHRHFGYNAPPFFIAGAYVPSNDWKPWTEVPLE